MEGGNIELAKQLENKVAALLARFAEANETITKLSAENARLQAELQQQAEECKLSEERFTNYRLTCGLTGNSEQKAETRRRITQIVREIDRCIELLNR